jgi:NADPH2:quinone reductase
MSHGSLYVQGPTLNTYARTSELLRERAAGLFELIAGGRLDVPLGHAHPLSQARHGHEDLEARRTTGKLLLLPGE